MMRLFKYKTGLIHIALYAHKTLCGLPLSRIQREIHDPIETFPVERICCKCHDAKKRDDPHPEARAER